MYGKYLSSSYFLGKVVNASLTLICFLTVMPVKKHMYGVCMAVLLASHPDKDKQVKIFQD